MDSDGRCRQGKESPCARPRRVYREGQEPIIRSTAPYATASGGRGDGPVGKKYVPPTDLTSDYVQNKSAGEIFYAITNGGLGIMPKYADAIHA